MCEYQRSDLNISNCPRCGSRLMYGKIIVTGLLKCSKCRRHWVIQMEKNKVRACFKTIKVTKLKYRQGKQRHENRKLSFHTG